MSQEFTRGGWCHRLAFPTECFSFHPTKTSDTTLHHFWTGYLCRGCSSFWLNVLKYKNHDYLTEQDLRTMQGRCLVQLPVGIWSCPECWLFPSWYVVHTLSPGVWGAEALSGPPALLPLRPVLRGVAILHSIPPREACCICLFASGTFLHAGNAWYFKQTKMCYS